MNFKNKFPVTIATFQVLSSHMRLIVTILDIAYTENCRYRNF